ncbi:MAG: hypothetical protein ACRC5M_01365 [Anaeroplasmataceae bacterium]
MILAKDIKDLELIVANTNSDERNEYLETLLTDKINDSLSSGLEYVSIESRLLGEMRTRGIIEFPTYEFFHSGDSTAKKVYFVNIRKNKYKHLGMECFQFILVFVIATLFAFLAGSILASMLGGGE